MEKILHQFGCPKTFFGGDKKTFLGTRIGAGFFPSTWGLDVETRFKSKWNYLPGTKLKTNINGRSVSMDHAMSRHHVILESNKKLGEHLREVDIFNKASL